MKTHNIMFFSFIAASLLSGHVQAVEVNIETGGNKYIRSNSVNEGKVVINGKVIKGATRKMTKKEQKKLAEELNREEKKIEREMSEMEHMFD